MIAGARHIHSGKVRELYELETGDLLMVASDRISAFDFILSPEIPDKGKILTALSLWWFEQLTDLVPNHVISADVPGEVARRALIVERLDMYPIECVARGYLTGSGWMEYQETSTVCSVSLPEGLVDGSRLDVPIFTPAAKAEYGEHDENIDFESVQAIVGPRVAEDLRTLTLAIYARAETLARERGIILADTKFEFGQRSDGTIVLADEVLTPDSSRFWELDTYQPGKAQHSFDKQFLRDWLTSDASGWNRLSGEPPPELPMEIVEKTRARYVEAYQTLTGRKFD